MSACSWLTKRPLSQASPVFPTAVNLVVIVLSGELRTQMSPIMSLGTQGHIGSGRQCQLPPEEWSSECVLLPKKESNVAVTGYCK